MKYEQGGKVKAEYGQALLTRLSHDLTRLHGRGFSRSNLVYMRLFYLRYPISQEPSDLLSWSHYVEPLKIDDELERSLYEQQAHLEHWSVPELRRRYQFYLPDREELRRQLEMTLLHAEQQAEREAGQDEHATEVGP